MAFELDENLESLARRLAGRTGESLSEALRRSLAERMARLDIDAAEAASTAVPSIDGPRSGPAFEVRLFGHPMIHRLAADGRRHEVSWRLRRSLQAVAFLALSPGRRASKDELVESLWRGEGADAVKKNFHPTVSDARRSLSAGKGPGDGEIPTIAHRDGVYVLDPAVQWWIDVDVFRHLLRLARDAPEPEAELAHLESAWHLVRGTLVQGHDADWLDRPRDELYRSWLAALRRIGELAGGLDRPTLALDAWRRLLIEEPFEEQAHLEVMELYGRRGRRDLVRRQYVKLQELLTELDVEPAPRTQERYLELMR